MGEARARVAVCGRSRPVVVVDAKECRRARETSGACMARTRRASAASPAVGWGGGAVREWETSRWERWETRTRSLRARVSRWMRSDK